MKNIDSLLVRLCGLLFLLSGLTATTLLAKEQYPAPLVGSYFCYRFAPAVEMQNQMRHNPITLALELQLVPVVTTQLQAMPFNLNILTGGRYQIAGSSGYDKFRFDPDHNLVTFTGDINKFKPIGYWWVKGKPIFTFGNTNETKFNCEFGSGPTKTDYNGHGARDNKPLAQRTAAATASDYTAIFEGAYVCGKQDEKMWLKLSASGNGTMTGQLDYGGSQAAPLAIYTLTGTWSGNAFTLSSQRWIKQPNKNHLMVDITGHINNGQISGLMLYRTCDDFHVKRQQAK